VVVHVLDNDDDDANVSSVVIIDPANNNPVDTLVVPNEGTWSVDPATGDITFAPEDGYTGDPTEITYQAADTSGNKDTAKVTIDYPAVPDYRPTVNVLVGQNTSTPTATIKVSFRVVENLSGLNTGDVVLRIPKHEALTTNYVPNMTDLHGNIMNNMDWSFAENDSAYIMTYMGHDGHFGAAAQSYIGFEFTFTAPQDQRGKIPIKATIQGSISGDTVPSNDVDEDFLIFNNL